MALGHWKAFLIVLGIGLLGISIRLGLESGATPLMFDQSAWFQDRAVACLESNPRWGLDVCEKIARGDIWIGMTVDMTLASRGEPRRIERPNSVDSALEEWTYHSARHGLQLLYFEDGILTDWKNQEEGCSTCGV